MNMKLHETTWNYMMYMTIHMKSYECCIKWNVKTLDSSQCQGLGRGLAGGVLRFRFHWIPLASLILWQDWDKTVVILVYKVYELVCKFVLYVHCMFDMFLFRYMFWFETKTDQSFTTPCQILATPNGMARFADRPFTSRRDHSWAPKGWDMAGMWCCFSCCLFC